MANAVPNLRTIPPSTGSSSPSRDDKKGSHDKGRSDRGRGRARVVDNDDDNSDDLVDYIHKRDRLPRPTLKHRESSREGKRRHEYRYYEPQSQPAARDRPPRARSAERRGRGGRSSREENSSNNDRGARLPRRMSVAGGRADDHRRESRRRDGGGDNRRRASDDNSTGKKRSAAQNLGKAAVAAGALEAVRQRGKGVDSGGAWKRVATAALGAAAIDAAAAKVRGKDLGDQGKKSTLGASIGGLVVEGLVHRMRS